MLPNVRLCHPSHHRSRRHRRLRRLATLLTIAMLVALPLAPRSQAQGGDSSLPSASDQQQAAADLLSQLDGITGSIDPSSLTIDPALGPPPWTSFVPGRDQSTIDAWNALSARVSDPGGESPSRLALPNAVLAIEDIEHPNELGLNDTLETGQFVAGFGTGRGEEPVARVAGNLLAVLPPTPEPDCPSTEEDSAIPLANPTPLSPPEVTVVFCGGVIGDGEFGESSGDVDFFTLGEIAAGETIFMDTGSFDPNAVFALTTAIYSSDGTLLGSLNDTDSLPTSVLNVVAPVDDTYYAAIAGIDTLPTDPFDPSSGTGVSFVGEYTFFAGVIPAPPPPCMAVEPDSTIPEANVLPFGPGETAPCFGLIGDGEFGDSSGDFDFFALTVGPDSDIIVDIVPPPGAPIGSPTTIALYDPDGNLVAVADDDGLNPSDLIIFPATEPGTYYALVSSPGVLPEDPFDASSGTVAGPETSYVAFMLSIPRAGPPPPPPPPGPTPTPGPPPPGPEPIPTPTPTATPVPPGFGSSSADEARTLIDTAMQDYTVVVNSHNFAGFQELEAPCIPTEDDGSIPLANTPALEVDTSVECVGVVGDGPFGGTSGDFDFFAVTASANDLISAQVIADAGDLDSIVAILDERGGLLGLGEDVASNNSGTELVAPADGTYYVVVLAAGSQPLDPFDSSSGIGAASTGPYILTLGRVEAPPTDVDVFLVDLDVGDVLGAGFEMTGTITILDPTGRVGMQSGGSASIIYPRTSPLRHLGNVGADFVTEVAGVHAVILSNGPGRYEGELRVKRAGATDLPGDDAQILFLDFDGGQFNQAIFDPFAPDTAGPTRTLSPLADWLGNWGLTPADEDAVIDAIIAEFTDDLLSHLQEFGGNGNRDATGNGGELDIEIRNSRDHGDLWGQRNVSRIIIGGSIPEAGIPTVGIAQSIDPGNFATEETGIVLLDLLSAPAGTDTPTLNNFDVAAPLTKIDLVGRGVGVIAAHEAGHFLGNWHTASFNGVPSIMDEGGDIVTTIGIGPDLILGTADDPGTQFVTDVFSFVEGFMGDENTTVRTAQGLSTGQTDVEVVVELPDEGIYNLRNVQSDRVLDADRNGDIGQSTVPTGDDRWELIALGDDLFNLRNVDFGTYLDGDADGTVNQSQNPRSDDRWQLSPADDGAFFVFNVDRNGYLSSSGVDVVLSSQQTDAEQWHFDSLDSAGFIGSSIALQSATTTRWLDADADGSVGQSQNLSEDDIWVVTDSGDGNVYLVNAETGGYLDADGPNQRVDTSTTPSSDDRWQLVPTDGLFAVRNVDSGAYLHARGSGSGYNVVTRPNQSASTSWFLAIVDPLAGVGPE